MSLGNAPRMKLGQIDSFLWCLWQLWSLASSFLARACGGGVGRGEA